MSNVAQHHRELADAAEVEIAALALLMRAATRRRDAHRAMERFFLPPETPPPRIAPPPYPDETDPDFADGEGDASD